MFERWRTRFESGLVRNVVCLGDSITYAPSMRRIGITRPWVSQLANALEIAAGRRADDGFRGLWHRDEWTIGGEWRKTKPSDPFDVVPFAAGLYSSAATVDEMTWRKPSDIAVRAFDLLWFHMPDTGTWQFRVDGGRWLSVGDAADEPDNRLHRVFVDTVVNHSVDIRGFDGKRPCVAPIAGIDTYRSPEGREQGLSVHNVGHQEQLLHVFCRTSDGHPLALLDELRPELIIVFFSNDVRLHDAEGYEKAIGDLVHHVSPYANVLLVSPFEQRPRRIARAWMTAGSHLLVSDNAQFFPNDEGVELCGANIPTTTRIARVESATEVILTLPPTASSNREQVSIASVRDLEHQHQYRAAAESVARRCDCAHLDLYKEWRRLLGGGWTTAYRAGFMHDALHPTQRGHDHIADRLRTLLGLRRD